MRRYDNRPGTWRRIATGLRVDMLDAMVQPAMLTELPALGKSVREGAAKGRVVVDVNA